jgi:pyroglutamyl-peptidase
MKSIVLLSGFEPFGGEKINPSWEVARRFDGVKFNGTEVRAIRLPVNCRRAARAISYAIVTQHPSAVLGLGQAGGRVAFSIERVAVNLADDHGSLEMQGGLNGKPVVKGGPDAYFARLPLKAILDALRAKEIPAGLSLTAGVYVCNTVMYATLHALRSRRSVAAGFIHLPYATVQAVWRPSSSMSIDVMAAGVEVVLDLLSAS